MNTLSYSIVTLLLVVAGQTEARPQLSDSLMVAELGAIGTNTISDLSNTALGTTRELSNGVTSFTTDILNQGSDFVTTFAKASADTALDTLSATRALYDASTGYFMDQFGRTGRLTTAGLGTAADVFVAAATAGGAFTTALAQATIGGIQAVGDELGTFLVQTVDDTVNLAAGATDIVGGTGRVATASLGVAADVIKSGVTAGGDFSKALAQAKIGGVQAVGNELGTFLVGTIEGTVNLAAGATDVIRGTAITTINRFTGNQILVTTS